MNYNSDKYGFELIKSKKNIKTRNRNKNSSEKSLIFSKKIIAMLDEKVKIHNEKFNKKITLIEIKKAYKSAFNNQSKDLNKETLAYVNLFLRASEGNILNFLNSFGANFEVIGNQFTIKGNLMPEEMDYKQAEEDIKKYNLEDFDFKSEDELYLEDEEDRVIISDINKYF